MKILQALISRLTMKRTEEVQSSTPSGPRIMRSTYPEKKADFNEWANHVHREAIRARFGEKTFK